MPVILRSKFKSTLDFLIREAITVAEGVGEDGRRVMPESVTVSGTLVDDADINALKRVTRAVPEKSSTVTEQVNEEFEEKQTRESVTETTQKDEVAVEQTNTSDSEDTGTSASRESRKGTETAASSSTQKDDSSQTSKSDVNRQDATQDKSSVQQKQTQGTTSKTQVEYETSND